MLLASSARPGMTILDPFVGSGTTLVEAALIGLRGLGVDANPLAVELSRLKSTALTPAQCAALAETARVIGENSLERVKKRQRTKTAGSETDDPSFYAPHIFRELVGLREEIGRERQVKLQRALLLVLSSIVVKVSRQVSDTSSALTEKTLAKGFPSRLFVRKAEELERKLQAFGAVAKSAPADIRLGDARKLPFATGTIDLIVTSPPYVSTYDYVDHHARRYGWLGFDRKHIENAEIGARRVDPATALRDWQESVDRFVAEFARVLKPGGHVFVFIGDSTIEQKHFDGAEPIRRAAEQAKLTLVASAREELLTRSAAPERTGQFEHLIVLK